MILHLIKFIFSKQYRKQCVISDSMCSCGKYEKCIRKIKIKDGGLYVDTKDHFRCGKVQEQIKQMKKTIIMEAFDNELDNYLEEKEFECYECGALMDKDIMYCSKDCYKASML